MTLPSLNIAVQGQGSQTADNINTQVQWCDLVNTLRSIPGLNGMAIWVEGTTAFNDGGQGVFAWNASSTAPDDNGVTSVMPNGVTGAGRWIRQPAGSGTIAPGSLPLSALAPIPADTLLGNNLGSAGPVLALTVAQVVAMLGGVGVPTGSVSAFAGTTAPTGWYMCDGSAVSRTTDANLFSVISTAFGAGDGSTTFNLPNLLGRFVRGWDSAGSTDPGRTFASVQQSALQSHIHVTPQSTWANPTFTGQFGASTISVTEPGFTVAGTETFNLPNTNDGTTFSGYNPNPGGQVSPTETRPLNLALNYIIKR